MNTTTSRITLSGTTRPPSLIGRIGARVQRALQLAEREARHQHVAHDLGAAGRPSPAQPPMNIRPSRTIFAWSLQRLKSTLAKPVVVMIDTVWKRP